MEEKEQNDIKVTFGDFVLNRESSKLFHMENGEISISPREYDLLCLFLDHQNRVLSKESIKEAIWGKRVVSDANVIQNLAKLRSLLGDSAKDPTYIKTVIGEGFIFIANTEAYTWQPTSNSDNTQTTNNLSAVSNARWIIAVSLLFVIVILLILQNKSPKTSNPSIPESVTTMTGIEMYPQVTSDGKYIVFNNRENSDKSWNVYVKPINNESYYPLANTANDEMFPSISPDGRSLIFYMLGEDTCGLYLKELSLRHMTVSKPMLLIACEKSTSVIKSVWIDNENILLSLKANNAAPAAIFKFNVKEKQRSVITKPPINGYGDYSLSYSDKFNKLAYLRDIGLSSSEIWIYDLIEESHTMIRKNTKPLVSIDWGLSDEEIYFQSSSKAISKININSKEEAIVVTFHRDVSSPFLLEKNKLGILIGSYQAKDSYVYDINKNVTTTVVNSSYSDYSPTGNMDLIAFVSNRSGKPQVWIKRGNEMTRLTNYVDNYEIEELSISADSNKIIFVKNNSVNIINLDGDLIYSSDDGEVYAYPSFDEINNRVIYSVHRNGKWVIEARYMGTFEVTETLMDGYKAKPCQSGECIFFTRENSNYLYEYKNSAKHETPLLKFAPKNSWDVFEDDIYFVENNVKQRSLVKVNLHSGAKVKLYLTNVGSFSLEKNRGMIYSHKGKLGEIDIMSTNL